MEFGQDTCAMLNAFRHLTAIAVLQLAAGSAQACLFATSTKPEGWYEWSSGLFAGEVTAVEKDGQKPADVITVRVTETFKGPDASRGTLTVHISSRYWANCRVERPAAGARVLVAMNPNSEVMLVPLTESYAEGLRVHRGKQK